MLARRQADISFGKFTSMLGLHVTVSRLNTSSRTLAVGLDRVTDGECGEDNLFVVPFPDDVCKPSERTFFGGGLRL